MGAILAQEDKGGQFHVIAYASWKLTSPEKSYTPYSLEMQASVRAMEYFDSYLSGQHFKLYTDHSPLEKLGKLHTTTNKSDSGSNASVQL